MRPIQYLGVLCVFAFLWGGCQNNQPTNQHAQTAAFTPALDKIEQQNTPPTAARSPQDFETQLAAAFTKEQQEVIKNVASAFHNIKTAKELATFYRQTLPNAIELINRKLKKYDPEAPSNDNTSSKWAWITAYLPYVTVENFCTDCEPEAYIVVNPLREKAEITPEIDDNLFFEALMVAYQQEKSPDKVIDHQPNTWVYKVGCDVCGADILGSGKHINTLKALERAKKSIIFLPEAEQLWIEILPKHTTNYYYAQEEVLDELEQILVNVQLSNREKEKLKNIRYLLNTNKDTQFDCQKGNCQFLAM